MASAGAGPNGYRLIGGPPPVADYLELRRSSGLTPRRPDQAAAAIAGSWSAVHVVDERTGATVAMGRVLGDGGWYFHVVDMAVAPGHQRRGLGSFVLSALLDTIGRDAPPGAYVNLLADPPGLALYARHGFKETAPDSVGMALVLGDEPGAGGAP
jgi:GNAT superfamily N-acetyltransferase